MLEVAPAEVLGPWTHAIPVPPWGGECLGPGWEPAGSWWSGARGVPSSVREDGGTPRGRGGGAGVVPALKGEELGDDPGLAPEGVEIDGGAPPPQGWVPPTRCTYNRNPRVLQKKNTQSEAVEKDEKNMRFFRIGLWVHFGYSIIRTRNCDDGSAFALREEERRRGCWGRREGGEGAAGGREAIGGGGLGLQSLKPGRRRDGWGGGLRLGVLFTPDEDYGGVGVN